MTPRELSLEIEPLLARLPDGSLLGVGVDIETTRTITPDAARFFLTDAEREWLTGLSVDVFSRTLLRLWTVKEAILKADPAGAGKKLGDYTLENPADWTGTAYPRGRALLRFHYASVQNGQGFLSIALALRRVDDA